MYPNVSCPAAHRAFDGCGAACICAACRWATSRTRSGRCWARTPRTRRLRCDRSFGRAAAIARLPGRKLVFTNGDAPYAGRILERLGLGETFEAVHDIHAMELRPKPATSAYQGLCDAHGIDPTAALFVDDMARNLTPAKAIGMMTVWVDNGSEQAPDPARDGIDYTVAALGPWLDEILEDA